MRWYAIIISAFMVVISACSGNISTPSPLQDSSTDPSSKAPLSQDEIENIAWQALEPNTSSHDRDLWGVVEMRGVTGKDIQEIFEGEPVPGGCVSGPRPPENQEITLGASYWYVQMKPIYVTPKPIPTEQYSPTAPPRIPEPFLRDAHFLIDPNSGEVVARKLFCIVY